MEELLEFGTEGGILLLLPLVWILLLLTNVATVELDDDEDEREAVEDRFTRFGFGVVDTTEAVVAAVEEDPVVDRLFVLVELAPEERLLETVDETGSLLVVAAAKAAAEWIGTVGIVSLRDTTSK